MREQGQATNHGRGFEAIADAIMYRWSVERDIWVGPREIAHARAYLEEAGITISELPDGRFVVDGETGRACEAARLVLLGIQHLQSARRGTRAPRPAKLGS
jgi:hypothetical protein